MDRDETASGSDEDDSAPGDAGADTEALTLALPRAPRPAAAGELDERTSVRPRRRVDDRAMLAEVEKKLLGAPAKRLEVGRFVLQERLGGGSMGSVYRAYDPQLDRRVALKLLAADAAHPELSSERLLREAMALARVDHPNVVTVHEAGREGNDVFVVMELVDGVDLHEWMRLHPPTDLQRRDRALDLIVQAAAGLAAVHDAGLVHRDFKPGNLLLGADGRVCVADFGFARVEPRATLTFERPGRGTRPSVGEDTGTGIILGTPRYMAPEQAAGIGVDARSDQFAFCVSAWELLWGRSPWATGKPGSGPIVEPPDAPPALLDCLRRGLEEDPAARHPSMDGLASRLRQVAAATSASGDPPAARWRRPSGIMLAGIAVLGIGAVVLAVQGFGTPHSTASAPPHRQPSAEAVASPPPPAAAAAEREPPPDPVTPSSKPEPTAPAQPASSSAPDPGPAQQSRRATPDPGPDSRVRTKASARAARQCASETGPSQIEIRFLIEGDGRPALLRSSATEQPRATCSEEVLRATRFRRGPERRETLTVTFGD